MRSSTRNQGSLVLYRRYVGRREGNLTASCTPPVTAYTPVHRLPNYLSNDCWATLLDDKACGSPFLDALRNLAKLEDLTLTLNSEPVGFYYHDEGKERMVENLFRTIKDAPIRRLVLEGDWVLSESQLVDFVRDHVSTLQCLVLYGSILNGDWTRALHDIANMTRDTLQYISVRFSQRVDEDNRVVDEVMMDDSSEARVFSCAVDFSTYQRLLSDSEEDESDDDESADEEGTSSGNDGDMVDIDGAGN
jgi:hypothetical protein